MTSVNSGGNKSNCYLTIDETSMKSGKIWYSRPELNRDQRFRKPLLYPFELRERCERATSLTQPYAPPQTETRRRQPTRGIPSNKSRSSPAPACRWGVVIFVAPTT